MALKNLNGFVKMAIADNKDIAGMEDEIFRLRELNNNQAMIIANNRTKRSDFNVCHSYDCRDFAWRLWCVCPACLQGLQREGNQ